MGLSYIHSKGIVYGDLKPENILLDNYGYIKIIDFGSARFLNGKSSVQGVSGTPEYMAPEVISSKQISKESDWWSFGILM